MKPCQRYSVVEAAVASATAAHCVCVVRAREVESRVAVSGRMRVEGG